MSRQSALRCEVIPAISHPAGASPSNKQEDFELPTLKSLFDASKHLELLEEAIKKAKQDQSGGFPFAFGMGKGDAKLVIDWKKALKSDRLYKEMKKEQDKVVVGVANVSGRQLSLKVELKKGNVKEQDVRKYLNKNKLAVSKAVIQDSGAKEEKENGAKKDKDSG